MAEGADFDQRRALLTRAADVMRTDAGAVLAAAESLDPSFYDVVYTLLDCRGKVLVAGMGTSGASARRVAHLLSCCGTPALFVHAADGLHGGLGSITSDDVLIVISKGGESDELNEFCRRAKARGSRTVAMTAVATSRLSKLCDQTLVVKTPPEADPAEMMAMGSALAACAVGDALAVTLMELRQYPLETFEFTHPGGAVGKLIEGQREPGSQPSDR